MAAYLFVIRILGRGALARKQRADGGLEILLTGTFYSGNWIIPHLKPLAMSCHCKRLRMVATSPVPSLDKVEPIYPPKLLISVIGQVPARLVTFLWVGLKDRPDIVGGFHLLLNGLMAILLARVTGARSLYFCGGGPIEVMGGGYSTENRLFRILKTPDQVVENYLIRAVKMFDLIITMGHGAVKYFKMHGVDTVFHVVPGGFDGARFRPAEEPPIYDLVLVGRLSDIKRVDIFLRTVRCLIETGMDIRAVVVGDGPSRQDLEKLSQFLGILGNVSFVGQQQEIETWLRRSRVFVLTSDSEGLSQAMIQGMLCGLPAVVSHVGDLGDLVEDGVNGYLISDRTPEIFAERIHYLLNNFDRMAGFGRAARLSAERYLLENVTRTWDRIFQNSDQPAQVPQKGTELTGIS